MSLTLCTFCVCVCVESEKPYLSGFHQDLVNLLISLPISYCYVNMDGCANMFSNIYDYCCFVQCFFQQSNCGNVDLPQAQLLSVLF